MLLSVLGAALGCDDFSHLGALRDGRTSVQRSPQLSPDGSLIVFGHDSSVHSIDSDGSRLRLLSENRPDDSLHLAFSPSISPNGSRIAYAAYAHSTGLPWNRDYQWEIVTAVLDGSDIRRLTKTRNRKIVNLHPVWSPDGTRIAFVSNRVDPEPAGEEAPIGKFAIFTMAPDGSDVRNIAPSIRTRISSPVWSPDGRSLAFVAFEPDSESGAHEGILYTVGADGSGLTRVGETMGRPAWSPGGSRVAFVRTDDIEVALHTAAPDGSDPTRVLGLSPNPPKDTDGRREGSGRGWVRELQGRWPGVLG